MTPKSKSYTRSLNLLSLPPNTLYKIFKQTSSPNRRSLKGVQSSFRNNPNLKKMVAKNKEKRLRNQKKHNAIFEKFMMGKKLTNREEQFFLTFKYN